MGDADVRTLRSVRSPRDESGPTPSVLASTDEQAADAGTDEGWLSRLGNAFGGWLAKGACVHTHTHI
jgi:hypothetical protein